MTAHTLEQALIAADPQLPGLEILLDKAQLLAALRQLAPFTHARTLHTSYLRYKPGTSCVLALEIDLGDGEPQRWYAKAMSQARFAQSWAHPKRQAMVNAGHPHAPLALAQQAIMLQHPSQDRDIRYLSLFWDEHQRTALLNRWLPGEATGSEIDWRFLRYKPGRRCVVGIYRNATPLAVVRCASAKEYGTMLQGCATGSALSQLELLGLDGHLRMTATRWTPGQSLDRLLTTADMPALLHKTGKALAAVHSAAFTPALQRNLEDILRPVWREQQSLAVVYPQMQRRFERSAARLEHHIGGFSAPPTVLHGDFSADQVVVTPDASLRIIDWDRSSSGHPFNDLGTFIARLEMDVIEGLLSRDQADRAREALLAGYCATRAISLEGLEWYSVQALLCLATEPFRQRATDWPQRIERLLTRVEQLCDTASQNSADWQNQLRQLTTAQGIEAPLKHALALAPQATLLDASVLRHKPGRRALIAYRLDTGAGAQWTVLGKYREKGLDSHAFACQQALWQDGFSAGQPVSVPEPLTTLASQKLWLQQQVAGITMTAYLQANSTGDALMTSGTDAGIALAALQHSAGLHHAVGTRRWTLHDELRVLEQGFNQVAVRYPAWQTRLSALLNACHALAARLSGVQQRVLHRDFYPDQILVNADNPRRLTLLDFDLCCIGPAALDAGNYLAHVSELALRQHGELRTFALHESAFCDAWLSACEGVNAAEVQMFRALSLARHIFLSTRFSSRTHTTAPLLDSCEKLMESFS